MSNETDIHSLLEKQKLKRAAELLSNNPVFANITNAAGQTVFWYACGFGYQDLVEQMLDEPIRPILDVFKCDRLLRSPLDIARHYNNKEIVAILEPIFGAGVYSLPESSTRRHYSEIYEGVLDRLDHFHPAALAASLVAIVASVVILISFTSNPYKEIGHIIANAGDDFSVREAIIAAQKSHKFDREEFAEIQAFVRSKGWSDIQVTRTLLPREPSSKYQSESIECRIELIGDDNSGEISLELNWDTNSEPVVALNEGVLRTGLRSTKIRILQYAIYHCFS